MVDELDENLNANQDKRRHVRHLDWRLISSFVYVFGLLFLLLGLYTYIYYKTTWIGQIGLAFTPYQNYALPIIVAGIVLMIMGYVTEQRTKKKIKSEVKQQPITNIGACPSCGAKRDVDAQYCKKCGTKFE